MVKQAVSAQKRTQLQTLVGSSSPRECSSSPHATKAGESFEDEMEGTKSAAGQLPCACSSNARRASAGVPGPGRAAGAGPGLTDPAPRATVSRLGLRIVSSLRTTKRQAVARMKFCTVCSSKASFPSLSHLLIPCAYMGVNSGW